MLSWEEMERFSELKLLLAVSIGGEPEAAS